MSVDSYSLSFSGHRQPSVASRPYLSLETKQTSATVTHKRRLTKSSLTHRYRITRTRTHKNIDGWRTHKNIDGWGVLDSHAIFVNEVAVDNQHPFTDRYQPLFQLPTNPVRACACACALDCIVLRRRGIERRRNRELGAPSRPLNKSSITPCLPALI